MATKVTMTNNSEANTPTFGSLTVSEWFVSDGELYCKVAPSDEENNAFYPRGSCLVDFDMCEKVTPVNEIEICF